jgi:hypothetical protein
MKDTTKEKKKVFLHKKAEKPDMEEDSEKLSKGRFIVTLPPALNKRFNIQCKRLTCGVSTVARMAIVKFIEDEESRQRALEEAKITM